MAYIIAFISFFHSYNTNQFAAKQFALNHPNEGEICNIFLVILKGLNIPLSFQWSFKMTCIVTLVDYLELHRNTKNQMCINPVFLYF